MNRDIKFNCLYCPIPHKGGKVIKKDCALHLLNQFEENANQIGFLEASIQQLKAANSNLIVDIGNILRAAKGNKRYSQS